MRLVAVAGVERFEERGLVDPVFTIGAEGAQHLGDGPRAEPRLTVDELHAGERGGEAADVRGPSLEKQPFDGFHFTGARDEVEPRLGGDALRRRGGPALPSAGLTRSQRLRRELAGGARGSDPGGSRTMRRARARRAAWRPR